MSGMPKQTFFNLPEDKKTLIIEAAVNEFYEKGFEKASIAKVIEGAKIPRGSFYQYFEDKNDLYGFIIIEIIGSKKHLYFDMSSMDKMNFLDVIKQLFISGINFYKNEPKFASIATEFLHIRDLTLKQNILVISQNVSYEFLKNLIYERKRKGEICEEINSKALISLINTINFSFVDYFIENENLGFANHDLMNYLENMLFILNNGIKANGK